MQVVSIESPGAALDSIGSDARRVFAHFDKRSDAVRVLLFDRSGMCQFYNPPDRGVLRQPEASHPRSRHVEVEESLVDALLNGTDLADAPSRLRSRACACTDSSAAPTLLTPAAEPVTDFYEAYRAAGGKGGGGFCSIIGAQRSHALTLLLFSGSLAFFVRRRGRRQGQDKGRA
jgi:hypothetical protein